MILSLIKRIYFRAKNPPLPLFKVSSYFDTHAITLLLEIFGGRIHGPSSPPQILGRLSPRSTISLTHGLSECLNAAPTLWRYSQAAEPQRMAKRLIHVKIIPLSLSEKTLNTRYCMSEPSVYKQRYSECAQTPASIRRTMYM